MKKTVALIFGGEGKEHDVSEASAQNLASLIDTDTYNLIPVGITRDGRWYIYEGPLTEIKGGAWQNDISSLKKTYPAKLGKLSGLLSDGGIIPVDCAIPCLHGDFGEDGIIQASLTAAHIKYIGQDIYSSVFTSDKAYTKLAAEYLEIPTARWMLLTESSPKKAKSEAERNIKFPMFLKPTRLGSSYGAHPVYSDCDFENAYTDAYSYEGRVLIEELIPVKYELECAFLESDGILLAPYGKITTGGAFYGYDEKYKAKNSITAEVSYEDIAQNIKNRVLNYSERLVSFLGLKHLSRIDFFITEAEDVYFNEINAFPGMTDTSLYPKLTEAMGLRRGDFINLLIKDVCV